MEDATKILQRRVLRKKYRDLKDHIRVDSTVISSVSSVEFRDYHKQINQLFEVTENVRELGIDADALTDLARAVKGQAIKLSDISTSFNFRYLAYRLTAKYSRPEIGYPFDWESLGRHVGGIFISVPPYGVMNGPLAKEVKLKKKQERYKSQFMEEEKPVNIQQGHGSAENELEATTERIQKLATVLFDLNEEKASDKPVLSLSQLLIDHEDPVQTIENFFDLSFLIKSKSVTVTQDDKGELWAETTLTEELKNEPKSQMRASTSALERTPLHRSDAVYAARDQADLLEKLTAEKIRKKSLHSERRDDGYSEHATNLLSKRLRKMIQACRENDIETVKTLLNNDVHQLHKKGKFSWKPLHWACYNGNYEIAVLLITRGASVQDKTKSGDTPLHLACWKGNEILVSYLIEKGAETCTQNYSCSTPLHWACKYGRADIVNLLLKHDIRLDHQDKERNTALDLAMDGKHFNVVALLLEAGLVQACRNSNDNTSRESILRFKKKQAFERDSNGKTLLVWAVIENCVLLMRQLLLLTEVDRRAASKDMGTADALKEALCRMRLDAVCALVLRGVDWRQCVCALDANTVCVFLDTCGAQLPSAVLAAQSFAVWFTILSVHNQEALVQSAVNACPSLAEAEDDKGRLATDVALPEYRHILGASVSSPSGDCEWTDAGAESKSVRPPDEEDGWLLV